MFLHSCQLVKYKEGGGAEREGRGKERELKGGVWSDGVKGGGVELKGERWS